MANKKEQPKDNLKKLRNMNAAEQVEYYMQATGYKVLAKAPEYWLDTGFPRLNRVLGSEEKGVAYGKIITIAGPSQSGKTALAAFIAGLAQADGAKVGWGDAENSFDREHARKQGLDAGHRVFNIHGDMIGYTKIALFKPEFGQFIKKKKEDGVSVKSTEYRMEHAEEFCKRMENWMTLQRVLDPNGKLVVVLDSTNAISPAEEEQAGLTDQNMRTRSSNAVFLNLMTKRWVNIARHVNALVILIAQLRHNPKQMFGNPEYISGGNGILYFPSVIAWMRRVKGGELLQAGEQVGTKGVITNKKNKAGAGSVEHKKVGYYCYFFKKNWKFVNADKMTTV